MLNRSLEVFAAQVFLATMVLGASRKAKMCAHALIIWTIIVGFTNVGVPFGKYMFIRHIPSESIQVGLIASYLVFLLSLRFPGRMTQIVCTGLIAGFLFSPWIFAALYQIFEYSGIEVRQTLSSRFEIWNAVSMAIPGKLLFGAGIDSMRYYGLENVGKINTHPHNMFLQVWLDLGVVGVSIITGLIIVGWRAIAKMPYSARPAINASIVMLSVLALTTHSLWQTWFMSLIALVVILIVLLNGNPEKKPGQSAA